MKDLHDLYLNVFLLADESMFLKILEIDALKIMLCVLIII